MDWLAQSVLGRVAVPKNSAKWCVYAVSLDLTFTTPRVVFMAQKGDGELRLRECIRKPTELFPFLNLVNRWLDLEQVWARLWATGWTIYSRDGIKRDKALRVC